MTLGLTEPEHPGTLPLLARGEAPPNAAPTIAVPAGPLMHTGPAGDQPEDRTP